MIRVRLRLDGLEYDVRLADGIATVDGQPYPVRVHRMGTQSMVTAGDAVHVVALEDAGVATIDGRALPFAILQLEGEGVGAAVASAYGPLRPPMPGRIEAIAVQEGQDVQAGDVLFVLEAMKMRNEVRAPGDGRVRDIRVRPGDAVDAAHIVLHLDPAVDPTLARSAGMG